MPDDKDRIKNPGLKEIAGELGPIKDLPPPQTHTPRLKWALSLFGAAVLGVVVALVAANATESDELTVTSTMTSPEASASPTSPAATTITTTTTSTVTVTAPPADDGSDEGAGVSP